MGREPCQLPPMPVPPPDYATRLLPSTVCLWNETRLLNRYMYKMRNQHRSTPYFHRLQLVRCAAPRGLLSLTDEKQVSRTLRRLGTVEARLQSVYERRDATTAPQEQEVEEVRQLMQLVGQLADKIREACQLAYKYVWPDIEGTSPA